MLNVLEMKTTNLNIQGKTAKEPTADITEAWGGEENGRVAQLHLIYISRFLPRRRKSFVF